jgi:hypothetical protein
MKLKCKSRRILGYWAEEVRYTLLQIENALKIPTANPRVKKLPSCLLHLLVGQRSFPTSFRLERPVIVG